MERPITASAAPPGSAPCVDCIVDLEHCHESSIEHADGFTECLDPTCTLDHALHTWQLSCSVFDPPCACSPDEAFLPTTAGPTFELAA